jgi:5,10-methylenetetrahydromethanopterin reductase
MKYGLLLLGAHEPDRLLKLTKFAEAHDFEDLWYADEKFYRDPYVSLTYLSQHTERIRLGTCVTDPYTRHPALTAMAIGSLDEISNGRAVLGIGAGFSGLQALGMDNPKPVVALREAIPLIRQLLAGETVTVDGELTSFSNGELNFKARGDIPVLIATRGKLILRLAGEMADEVMFGDIATPRTIGMAMGEVRRGAERVNRSLDGVPIISRVNLILADDTNTAREPMRGWMAVSLWHSYPRWNSYFNYTPEWDEHFAPLREFVERHGGKPRNVGDFEMIAEHAHLITDDLVRDAALAGTVEDVARQIVEITNETDVTQITLYPMPLEGQTIESVLEKFAREVLPEVERLQQAARQ